MKKHIFKNGMKLIYKQSNSELTSMCFSLDAGAISDTEKLGVAHVTEHMIYKGTTSRDEAKINSDLSRVFGFQNAMTNYPYVIYYGTLLTEDIEEGIELFSDILVNPTFKEEGFKEEIKVILEELNEWDEDIEQYTEDRLFLNSYKHSRLKYPIIGKVETINSITLEDIKEFYKNNYFPGNTTISIISSMEFEDIVKLIEKYFEWISSKTKKDKTQNTEIPKCDIYFDSKDSISSSRVQIIASIQNLTKREKEVLRIFNAAFCEGVNSILFDTLRTKKGYVYDILSNIAFEKGIELYKIYYNISKENVQESIDIIKDIINNIENLKEHFSKEKIKELIKTLKIKKLFREEQSIQLAKELATYEIMFSSYTDYSELYNNLEDVTDVEIIKVAKKVLSNLTIQVVE